MEITETHDEPEEVAPTAPRPKRTRTPAQIEQFKRAAAIRREKILEFRAEKEAHRQALKEAKKEARNRLIEHVKNIPSPPPSQTSSPHASPPTSPPASPPQEMTLDEIIEAVTARLHAVAKPSTNNYLAPPPKQQLRLNFV